jgi:hypothetical protein
MKFTTSTTLAVLASTLIADVSGQPYGAKTRGRALAGGDGPYGGKGYRMKTVSKSIFLLPQMITLLVGVHVRRLLLL